MKNIAKLIIPIQIEAKTGLHIGGDKSILEIGGVDNPVIKDPLTMLPIIPGSSLKGKMRSLLERYYSKKAENKSSPRHECSNYKCEICGLFGSSGDNQRKLVSRIIIPDLILEEDSIEEELPTEIKYENAINRLTAIANPRPLERVIRGAKFKGELIYNVISLENDEQWVDLLRTDLENISISLKLVEFDYLGGGGSRGSGKIEYKFLNLKKNFELDFVQIAEFNEDMKTFDFDEIIRKIKTKS